MSTPRRALVTGAGGFIGANLVRRLVADGHQVTGVVRPGGDHWRTADIVDVADIVEVDLCDEQSVDHLVGRTRPDWTFHLAAHGAYSWQADAGRIVATNVVATVVLADACAAAGCDAFVHAGSSSEYGFKDHAPREDEALEPNSRYAVAKASATLFCRYVAEREAFPAVTLRLYSVFGPFEDPRRLVPALVVHGLRKELPPLVSPDTARDLVWVGDVVDAFVLAAATARTNAGAVYNVGTGEQTTVADLVEVARRALDIEAPPVWGTMPARVWDTTTWVADTTAIEAQLGWRPSTSLVEGFRRTVEWLSGNPRLWNVYDVRG
ncbi:MAG: NAD-dependent epimerase/dehydratase family protein [Actinomycetota bacterium]|nr:NAD-dependent epimerase/dehydratase family protein [Actinomycetota bacterium]